MKSRSLHPLCLVLAAGCTGGAGDNGKTTSTTTPKAAETGTFKVALITPGPVSDSGWNALAYQGLQAIQDSIGAQMNNEEASGTAIKNALRSHAQKGYN